MAWRSPWGPRSGASGTASSAACTTRRTTRGIDAGAAASDERRRTRPVGHQAGPQVEPCREGARGGAAERHGTLLASLAENPGQSAMPVEVTEVEAAQFRDPHSAGVERLHDGKIAGRHRGGLRMLGFSHPHLQSVEDARRGPPVQRGWQRSGGSGRAETGGRVGVQVAVGQGPRPEHADGRDPPRHCGALGTVTMLVGKPQAQQPQVDLLPVGDATASEKVRQRGEVAAVGAHRVFRQVAAVSEMVGEGIRQRLQPAPPCHAHGASVPEWPGSTGTHAGTVEPCRRAVA